LNDIVKQTEDEKVVRGRGTLKAGLDERTSGGGAFRRKMVRGSTPYDLGHTVRRMDDKWEHDLYVEEDSMQDAGELATYGGKIKIANLASTVSESDLRGIFGEAGTITKVIINFGNAEMFFSRMGEAVEAVKTFNGISLEGRDLAVSLGARSGSAHASGSSSGRRSYESGGLRMAVGKGGRTVKLTQQTSTQPPATIHRITGLGGMGVYEGVGQRERDTRQVPRRSGFRSKGLIVSRGPSGVRKVKKTTKEDLDADLDSIMTSRE